MTTSDTPESMDDGMPDRGAAAQPDVRPAPSPSALRHRRRKHVIVGLLAVAVVVGGAAAYVGHQAIYHWGWLASVGGPPVPGTVQGPMALTWRDAAGIVRTITVDAADYQKFMVETIAALNKARTETADIARAKLQAETALVFSEIDDRIPLYASWHFRYTTKYVLMAEAVYALWTRKGGLPVTGAQTIETIQNHLGQYLEDEYKDRLLHPAETRTKVEAAFERNVAELRTRWMQVIAEQNRRFAEFVATTGDPGKPIVEGTLGDGKLDWDLKIDAALPAERVTYRTFRSGLLTIKASHPATLAAGDAPAEDESDAKDRADDVAQVVVTLFSSVIDPLANESGALVASMVAGTVGAMAGHSAALAAGAVPATGVALTVPLGALVGVAMTVSSDIATTRLEEHLTRPAFEDGVRDALTKANQAIDKALAALLEEHANARFLEASRLVGVPPVAGGG
jgi:hypothetical protein